MSAAPTGTPSGHPQQGGEEDEDVTFIDELPEYLKCAICLCVLKEPYQVRERARE